MITKISIIGTMENRETRTASVSVKGREFNNKDCEKLVSLDMVHINPNMERFEEIKMWLEMRKNQWAKPYRVSMVYEPDLPFGTIADEVVSMLMVADYEIAVGRFKDCKF
ncbi:hypothetical protein LK537_16370 [Lachnoclostridium pacaense]|uniref:hypothetical protein n=1 Tax=Enterocloster hominis (ex Hitch et al. 2024) TaxID=1917870 RepID=UPI001D1002CA|nr:hypothetical protein [Lachnoclostridium pacaense]MCC2818876.1 hypothetical protein [Lachnoclostridium pacaense]